MSEFWLVCWGSYSGSSHAIVPNGNAVCEGSLIDYIERNRSLGDSCFTVLWAVPCSEDEYRRMGGRP